MEVSGQRHVPVGSPAGKTPGTRRRGVQVGLKSRYGNFREKSAVRALTPETKTKCPAQPNVLKLFNFTRL
jgi:hypothetical protein